MPHHDTPSSTNTIPLPRLLAGGVLRWFTTLALYGFTGLVACGVAYWTLHSVIWNLDVPSLPVGRAGPVGLLFFLLYFLVSPPGVLTVLFLFALPLGFALLGHQVGIGQALAFIARSKSAGLSQAITARVWPAIGKLSDSGRLRVTGAKAKELLAETGQGGLRRRLFARVLSAARVPVFVTSTDFLSRAHDAPEAAQKELEAHITGALRGWTEVSTLRPLFIALGALLLATWGVRWWFGG